MIVVEGKDDTVRIKLAVEADTIETNGSAINEATLKQIKLAQEKRGVIVFTDPDFPGERIRRIIDEHVSGCKHAFLPKEKAKSKHGLGVEHATVADIRHALQSVHTLREDQHEEAVDWRPLLLQYGLIGGPLAKTRRNELGNRLHIGYANAKQLEKRLHAFQISRELFEQTMQDIVKEEGM